MKFEFSVKGSSIREWGRINRKLEEDLLKLVHENVSEKEIRTYIKEMMDALRPISSDRLDRMLFLMHDEPSSMPADARVDFVYRPTYIAATIMMTAVCRFESVQDDSEIMDVLHDVLNAAMGRNFCGAGYDTYEGLLDTLEIFAKGDTVKFLKRYSYINPKFSDKLNDAIRFLQTDICSGKVKNAWSGYDYSKRGNQVLQMLRGSKHSLAQYVWYACYGSNLGITRFKKYINRCSDKTMPIDIRPFVFPHNIYFAKNSSVWGGAKAFLDDTSSGFAYGRIYKITRAQYEEIKYQEGMDYRKELKFDMIDEIPVYSFTDTQRNQETGMPSAEYFQTIFEGLKECCSALVAEGKLAKYLIDAILPANAFVVVKEIKQNPHYLTNREIIQRSGLEAHEAIYAVKWLLEKKVIQQDIRSIRAGHQVDDENAYFYTVNSQCARELVAAMLRAYQI